MLTLANRLMMRAGAVSGIELVGIVEVDVTTGDVVVDLTALTGGIDTAAAVGDFIVVCEGNGGHYANISGYTTIKTVTNFDSSASPDVKSEIYTAYKISTGDTSVTVLRTSGNYDVGTTTILVFRGVDPTTPLDVIWPLSAKADNNVLADPPAITPVTDGAVVVCVGHGGIDTGSSATRSYSSTDFDEFFTNWNHYATDGGGSVIGVGYKKIDPAGAFNPAAFTLTGADSTNDCWTAVSFVLRPAI